MITALLGLLALAVAVMAVGGFVVCVLEWMDERRNR